MGKEWGRSGKERVRSGEGVGKERTRNGNERVRSG